MTEEVVVQRVRTISTRNNLSGTWICGWLIVCQCRGELPDRLTRSGKQAIVEFQVLWGLEYWKQKSSSIYPVIRAQGVSRNSLRTGTLNRPLGCWKEASN